MTHLYDATVPTPMPYDFVSRRMLWGAVLHQAIKDATYCPSNGDKNNYLNKHYARHWILSNCEDFVMVCDLAGACPQRIRKAVLFFAEHIKNPSKSINLASGWRK